MKIPPIKKIILLLFLSLFFSSISHAGIEDWEDSSVCAWLKSSGGKNNIPIAEAKKRELTCKDGKVVANIDKYSTVKAKLEAEALMAEIFSEAKETEKPLKKQG